MQGKWIDLFRIVLPLIFQSIAAGASTADIREQMRNPNRQTSTKLMRAARRAAKLDGDRAEWKRRRWDLINEIVREANQAKDDELDELIEEAELEGMS
jgi:DNA-binding transcriptional MerR regulator